MCEIQANYQKCHSDDQTVRFDLLNEKDRKNEAFLISRCVVNQEVLGSWK
jgi:hypothetical protein